MKDWYFGKEQAEQYGDLICENLAGKTVSKRIDLGELPGGLVYEANELGIDMWDLLKALEGLCYQGRAAEIDDSTYKIFGCDNIESAEDVEIQDYVIDDATQRYVHSLIGQIQTTADDYGVTILKADIEGDQFVVSVEGHSEVYIPVETLGQDFNSIDADAEGILQVALGMANIEDVFSCDTVTASDDLDDEPEHWDFVTSKQVLDSDGFWTEYTMYQSDLTGNFVCIFGDSDYYTPENTEPDFECDDETEAYEWFDSYEGFAEDFGDDDDIDYSQADTAFGFDKITARTWEELLSDLEKVGLFVDGAYSRGYTGEDIIAYDSKRNVYYIEVTEYSDGKYEVMSYNVKPY